MQTFQHLVSSQSNEWYTPKEIIDSAKHLMGGIDIDPASNAIAQEWIGAKVFYSVHDDGFQKQWYGRLWLNPPYGKKGKGNHGAGAWFSKAINEFKISNVTEGLILGRGDSQGIKQLTQEFYFVECDRVSFVAEDGIAKNKPVPGTRIFYLGSNVDSFAEVFSKYGIILKAIY